MCFHHHHWGFHLVITYVQYLDGWQDLESQNTWSTLPHREHFVQPDEEDDDPYDQDDDFYDDGDEFYHIDKDDSLGALYVVSRLASFSG